jgi:hypothetical protein
MVTTTVFHTIFYEIVPLGKTPGVKTSWGVPDPGVFINRLKLWTLFSVLPKSLSMIVFNRWAIVMIVVSLNSDRIVA